MDRYAINLSAARVLKVIERLVYASRMRGVKDRRGVPYCYASKEWIAGQIGKSVRTVARAIRDLKAAGLIECRRTRSNAMLFITGYEPEPEARPAMPEAVPSAEARPAAVPAYAADDAMNDTSGSDTDVTSKISTQSNKTIRDTVSVDLTTSARTERTDRRERSASDAHEALSRGQIMAVKRKLGDELRHRLISTGCQSDDEMGAAAALVDIVTDAVAADRDIMANGVRLSAGQFWDVVSQVRWSRRLWDSLKSIAARDCLGMIRNKRAYLLSSVYNCAVWDRFDGITPDMGELIRLAEG